jgi:hypothetical protein
VNQTMGGQSDGVALLPGESPRLPVETGPVIDAVVWKAVSKHAGMQPVDELDEWIRTDDGATLAVEVLQRPGCDLVLLKGESAGLQAPLESHDGGSGGFGLRRQRRRLQPEGPGNVPAPAEPPVEIREARNEPGRQESEGQNPEFHGSPSPWIAIMVPMPSARSIGRIGTGPGLRGVDRHLGDEAAGRHGQR